MRYVQSACHSARHVSNSAQSHGSGAKIKESYFIGLESKLFFLRGVNRNSPKLQGGKSELAQITGGKYILTL